MTAYIITAVFSVVLLVLVIATYRERKAAEKRFIIDRCTSQDIRTAGSRPSLTLAGR